LACQQIVLSQKWLILAYSNVRSCLESTAAQWILLSQQALSNVEAQEFAKVSLENEDKE
jgi:hypothetical protein